MNTDKLVSSFTKSWNALIEQIPEILLSIFIIGAGIFIANKIAAFFRRTIAAKSDDPLMTNFLVKSLKLLFILGVIMFALRIAGLHGVATGLLTAAGASAVILGFAFKDIGENFISGIILSFNRPFLINDTVSIGDIFGKVKAMEFRYTKLKTFDGRDVYIPNSDVVRKPVFNYTEDGFIRQEFIVAIAYENSIPKAKKIIQETLLANPGIIKAQDKEPLVITDELAVNSVHLKVMFWVDTIDYRRDALETRSKVIEEVKDNLLTHDILMPSNIQELKWYTEDEKPERK